ncbi:hypothetical protein ACF08N_33785 [Streptomyces sp. NPDC015127]
MTLAVSLAIGLAVAAAAVALVQKVVVPYVVLRLLTSHGRRTR